MASRIGPSIGPGERGWALTRLIQVHDAMREDLALLRQVSAAEAVGDEAGTAGVLQRLSIRRPGWTLRAHCARFCGFVRGHHSVEDDILFPVLVKYQSADSDALEIVMDKLRADHRVLAGRLEQVERAFTDVPGDPAARVVAVDRLAEHLRAHLEFEETHLATAFNAMSRAMSPDDLLVELAEDPAVHRGQEQGDG